MARGIQVPLDVKNGRLRKLTGDDYIDQLIRTAVMGMGSDNPFQTLGLGEFMIFGINEAMSQGEIKERVISIFASFKADQLARLKDNEASITFKREGEEMRMTIEYINMETQEGRELAVPIPPTGE